MEIKTQNLTKMSKEQLYQLLFQKDISDDDREKVKSELIKREAGELYNQALKVRAGEDPKKAPVPLPSAQPVSGKKNQQKLVISPTVWLLLIFLVFVVSYVLYSTFMK